MNKKVLLAVLLSVATAFGVSAQKFNPDPSFLKGENQINVVFDYSQVKFDGTPKDKYYKSKGQDWVDEWEGQRQENNIRAFTSGINDQLGKLNVNVGEESDAQYTLVVVVLDCGFGTFSAGFLRSDPGKVQATINVVKTGTTETLASITMKVKQNSFTTVGTPVDFDRIYLAFSILGDEVGKKLYSALK